MSEVLSPGLCRAQVVLQHTSNLPQDRFVNTFWFRRAGSGLGALTTAEKDEVYGRLVSFYNTGQPDFGPHTYLSVLIHRETDTSQVRVYDMGQEEPREPDIYPWTLGAASSGGRLPQEAALCASFYGLRNVPRQRGRIYLGPFEIAALDAATARPSADLRATLAAACQDLEGTNGLMEWVTVHQTTLGRSSNLVTGGWVDNEFDTQRRRGQKSTARTTWTA